MREPGGVRHKALVIAHGVHESGRREVVGIDVGEGETQAFWREFLRGLRARGLSGVALCVSDAHEGLKAAIAKVLGSERLTGATLDRLTHRCQIIETKGESYRLRDAKARMRPPATAQTASAKPREPRRGALEGGQTSS